MRKILAIVFVALTGLSWYVNISAMRREPLEFQTHLQKAQEYNDKGIYVDAIDEYQSALNYDENNAEIKKKIAEAYLSNGNASKFVSLSKEIAEQNQEDTEALDNLMNYYLEQGNTKKAVQYIDEFVNKYPENENADKWFIKLKGSYSKLYCWYSNMGAIYNGYMLVSQNGLWGIADSSGSEIIEPKYEYAQVFSEDGYALVKSDNGYLYVDKKGQTRLVLEKEYDNPGMFSQESIPASKNGKYGLLNSELQPIADFKWENLTSIQEGMGAACQNGKWALIDGKGQNITDYIFDDVIRDEYNYCNNQGVIFVKINGTYQMVDEKGKKIGDRTFDNALSFSKDGYAAVFNGKKWGFVDTECNLVIDYQYVEAQSFSYGFAAVKNDSLWGYIDEQDNLVIEMSLYFATPFSEEGTAVMEDEEGTKELVKLDLTS